MSVDSQITSAPADEGLAAVRCHVMKGFVHVRDPAAISPLHSRALRAIALHQDLKEVLGAFGVGRRVMQDVLVDLFYSGLVYLDVHGGRVVVSPDVASAIASNRLEQTIAGEKPTEVEMTWVQEMVSGAALAYPLVMRYFERPFGAAQARSLVHKPSNLQAIENLSTRTLARAALPLLRERSPPAETILDRVERITNRKLVGSKVFYIPTRTLQPNPGGPKIIVPDVEGFPQVVIDAWTLALNPDRDPAGLSGGLGSPPLGDVVLPSILAMRWGEAIAALQHSPMQPGLVPLTSDQAAAVEDLLSVSARAVELATSSVVCEARGGPASPHFDLLDDLLARTKEILVVGSAFATQRGLDQIVSRVKPLMARGVRVLLVVGLPQLCDNGTVPALSNEVRDEVDRLASPLDPHDVPSLTIIGASAPFHSKFVIGDNELGIVSSVNWLTADPAGATWEASASFKGPLAKDVTATVLPALPRDSPFRTLLESGSARSLPSAGTAWAQLSDRIDRICRPTEAIDGISRESSAESSLTLEQALRRASEQVAPLRSLKGAAVVADSSHRRLLTSAIAGAKSEVVVSSDGLTPEGTGSVLTGLLEEASKRGVRVTLRWGRGVRGGATSGEAETGEQIAANLKARIGHGIDVNERPAGVHGKILIVDDEFALVSSFNFLSFGGVPGRERALSGELGVAISDPEVAKRLKESLLRATNSSMRRL